METKTFLENEYYTLEDVHALNTFLKGLPKPNMPKSMIEKVTGLLSCYESFDNPKDFVPGSAKYNEIIEKNRQYSEAQASLKELNYSKEIILDDCRAKLSGLTKNSITYTTIVFDTEYYGEVNEIEMEVTHFYYSVNYDNKVAINPMDYIMPYTCKQGSYGTVTDLIENHIQSYKCIYSELQAYKYCASHGIDINHFTRVFDIKNLAYFGYFDANLIADIKTDKEYRLWDVTKLIEDFQVASEKKYICEDRYVDYPRTSYVDFLENYIGKTYFEVENS